jgi:hypothetical protein
LSLIPLINSCPIGRRMSARSTIDALLQVRRIPLADDPDLPYSRRTVPTRDYGDRRA